MAQIRGAAVEQLRASLSTTAEVVTPDSENYAESIKRWASSAERPAVCLPPPKSFQHEMNVQPLRPVPSDMS
jgi:hypothetical protein